MFEVSMFNVTKEGLCASEKESFPIGNGDLGANVWIDQNEVLNVLLSKTDSISEATRLLKIGLVQIQFDRQLFSENNCAKSVLDLQDGTVTITNQDESVKIQVAAFRSRPLYGVRLNSKIPVKMTAKPVIWRTEERILDKEDDSCGLQRAIFPIAESADVLEDECTWYHHNIWSYANYTRRNQQMQNLNDYILNRAFGASFAINEKENTSTLYISAGCEIVCDPKSLTRTLRLTAKTAAEEDRFEEYLEENKSYWTDYFQQYYIYAYGDKDAEDISRLYTLQKYMIGCVNRGKLPIKFNGSIFSVSSDPDRDDQMDYDWRKWAGDYWIQNTRLVYWNMLYSGDFDGVRVFFDFCYERMPNFRENAKAIYKCDGILVPETMTVNGTYRDRDYGYGRQNDRNRIPSNEWVGKHINGMLEISWMMLEFLNYTKDIIYFNKVCLPFIQESLVFFRECFPMVDGKLCIEHVSSLETWVDCINNCPDVAGLHAITKRMKELGYPSVIDESTLPDIPTEIKNGKKVIAAYETLLVEEPINQENPELYTVFPFYLYHMAEGIPQMVQDTYDERAHRFNQGWSQNLIQAALLGRTQKCKDELPENFRQKADGYFFDAYFGPNFDWMPDQCHGSSCSLAFRMMLLQEKNGVILKLPAWPDDWKVKYRLPVAGSVVEVGKSS